MDDAAVERTVAIRRRRQWRRAAGGGSVGGRAAAAWADGRRQWASGCRRQLDGWLGSSDPGLAVDGDRADDVGENQWLDVLEKKTLCAPFVMINGRIQAMKSEMEVMGAATEKRDLPRVAAVISVGLLPRRIWNVLVVTVVMIDSDCINGGPTVVGLAGRWRLVVFFITVDGGGARLGGDGGRRRRVIAGGRLVDGGDVDSCGGWLPPPHVSLRWVHEQGVPMLVKSFSKERWKENLEILDWSLTREELEMIDQLPQQRGFPSLAFVSDGEPFKTVEELWDGEI
ncbi:hypothetical protein ACLOJK_025580 [Asimina triloba]